MAGRSTSFIRSKYKAPKWSVVVNGMTVLEHSLFGVEADSFIFVCNKWQYEKYSLERVIDKYKKPVVILVGDTTSGQAATAHLADSEIGNDDNLMVVSPNQAVDFSPSSFLNDMKVSNSDMGVVVSRVNQCRSKPYYATVNEEKVVAGIGKKTSGGMVCCNTYWFKFGFAFMEGCKNVITGPCTMRGEHQLAQVVNHMIYPQKGKAPLFKAHVGRSVFILDKPSDVRFMVGKSFR